jgi:uncharacterized protein YecE (DUF72 family)
MPGAIHIGCSGWHYKHWKGPFYPEKLPASKMLDFYSQHLDTVELNTTFYRLPPPNSVENWRDSTPKTFLFAAKGSRFITHMKKLSDPETAIGRYFERVDRLGKKLGPIVFQTPPWWEINLERLETFLAALPGGHRYAFELRNPTWHTPEVYRLLKRHNAAFCIFEIAGFHSPIEVTANWTYVRLHGPGGAYQGSYPAETLGAWADRIRGWERELRGIYVYFDNDQAGFAVENALELKRRTGERVASPALRTAS